MCDKQKPTPKTLLGHTANSIGERGEKALHKVFNDSELVRGSGCGSEKGDLKVGSGVNGNPYAYEKMIEKKSTQYKSIKLKQSWLEKIVRQAHKQGKEPVLAIQFETMEKYTSKQWGLVPIERLKQLFDIEKEYYELIDKK